MFFKHSLDMVIIQEELIGPEVELIHKNSTTVTSIDM